MANEMGTYVTVKSEDSRVAEKLKELFTPREGQNVVSAIDLINRIKGTEYSFKEDKEDWNRETDWPDNDTWEKMIGPKWLYVEYDHQELPQDCNIVLRTAWSVPTAFLNVLRNELQKIDSECYIVGSYEDESYDPSGAFVYGKFDYDDMEDYDEPFDWDESDEDDFYTEKWHDEIYQLEHDVEKAYLEYLQDRIDNPQDYE